MTATYSEDASGRQLTKSRRDSATASAGSRSGDMLLQLQPVERGIAAALAQQFLVAAGFDDQAVLDHEDAIGMHDRREPVGDDQRRAALAKFGDRLLHVALGFRIERTRSPRRAG